MNVDRNKIIRMVVILGLLCAAVGLLSKVHRNNSMTLTEYVNQNSKTTDQTNASQQNNAVTEASDSSGENYAETEAFEDTATQQPVFASSLVGASLNNTIPEEQRTLYTEGFYYEPLSDNLRRYITGISYPDVTQSSDTTVSLDTASTGAPNMDNLAITYDDLRYVHIWHYNFDGTPVEGELICNQAIAQDLVEIFYELYRNEYQIEKVLLIDEYNGDDTASMEDNNTSCFNYRLVEGSTSLSKHALGLAIDINPLYNPYITYQKDGSENVSPVSAQPYADRSASFPYKIDEKDLCYRLFKEHGFTWGGDWNSCKDYQHFQKAVN